MSAKSIWEASELLTLVRTLTPLQRQLLTNLADRGPGLLLEVAVRVLKFPEDVGVPLRELTQKGLVRAETITGGQLGNELFSLTEPGRQAVLLLRNESLRKQLESATTRGAALESLPTPNPRQQEIELMRKLGDLAAQAGDLAKAQAWYEQALTRVRCDLLPQCGIV